MKRLIDGSEVILLGRGGDRDLSKTKLPSPRVFRDHTTVNVRARADCQSQQDWPSFLLVTSRKHSLGGTPNPNSDHRRDIWLIRGKGPILPVPLGRLLSHLLLRACRHHSSLSKALELKEDGLARKLRHVQSVRHPRAGEYGCSFRELFCATYRIRLERIYMKYRVEH